MQAVTLQLLASLTWYRCLCRTLLNVSECMQRKASESLDGLRPSDFRKSGHFPESHRISNQFPVVITPSEQVSEEVRQCPDTPAPLDLPICLAASRALMRLTLYYQRHKCSVM